MILIESPYLCHTQRVPLGVYVLMTPELGGKGAVIRFDDMDRDRAMNGAAFAAFIGAGQTCVCGVRILVQESIYPAFFEKFKRRSRRSAQAIRPTSGHNPLRWFPSGRASASWRCSNEGSHKARWC